MRLSKKDVQNLMDLESRGMHSWGIFTYEQRSAQLREIDVDLGLGGLVE